MDEGQPTRHGQHGGTERRREEIVRAAAETFGARGYYKGSLVEVANKAGMTHAGVLHHFGTKVNLLLEVLKYRDSTDVRDLDRERPPSGRDLFDHLVHTARLNEGRPGLVQTYAVLSAESVTDDHPARAFFLDRFAELRGLIADALEETARPAAVARADALRAAAAIIGAMDGLQVQWLLDPDSVRLADATAFAIDAIVRDVVRSAGGDGGEVSRSAGGDGGDRPD